MYSVLIALLPSIIHWHNKVCNVYCWMECVNPWLVPCWNWLVPCWKTNPRQQSSLWRLHNLTQQHRLRLWWVPPDKAGQCLDPQCKAKHKDPLLWPAMYSIHTYIHMYSRTALRSRGMWRLSLAVAVGVKPFSNDTVSYSYITSGRIWGSHDGKATMFLRCNAV
jgi:hypothetical protein